MSRDNTIDTLEVNYAIEHNTTTSANVGYRIWNEYESWCYNNFLGFARVYLVPAAQNSQRRGSEEKAVSTSFNFAVSGSPHVYAAGSGHLY